MAAYVIVDNEITDQALFEEYAQGIMQVTAAQGGKYLVRGGATEVIEGNRTPHRVVVIEFQNLDQAHGSSTPPNIFDSPTSAPSSVTTTFIVDGV